MMSSTSAVNHRVANKIFALERSRERLAFALWFKVPEGAREIPAPGRAARVFHSPYFVAKGWIGVGLDERPTALQVGPSSAPRS